MNISMKRIRPDREKHLSEGKPISGNKNAEKPKGLWARYLERLKKATDGKPPCCH